MDDKETVTCECGVCGLDYESDGYDEYGVCNDCLWYNLGPGYDQVKVLQSRLYEVTKSRDLFRQESDELNEQLNKAQLLEYRLRQEIEELKAKLGL